MQNLNFKLSQIKPLFYKNIILCVFNFNIQKDMKHLIKYERILYEFVEQKMIINILFEENEIDFKNLRKYENLSLNLYSQVNFKGNSSPYTHDLISAKI